MDKETPSGWIALLFSCLSRDASTCKHMRSSRDNHQSLIALFLPIPFAVQAMGFGSTACTPSLGTCAKRSLGPCTTNSPTRSSLLVSPQYCTLSCVNYPCTVVYSELREVSLPVHTTVLCFELFSWRSLSTLDKLRCSDKFQGDAVQCSTVLLCCIILLLHRLLG